MTKFIVCGGASDYSTEDIFEQCLKCERVDMEPQNGDTVFTITCKDGHTPYLNWHAEGEGDTLVVTQNYCKHRVKV